MPTQYTVVIRLASKEKRGILAAVLSKGNPYLNRQLKQINVMETIKWTDSFSVGVREMDNQHIKLVGMINRLIEEQHVLTEPTTIAELLTEMTDYAREHFRAEEYLMTEYGYEFIDRQVESHETFIAKTIDFMSASEVGPNILSKALLEYLKSWLVGHILNEDMQYKDFLHSKGVE